MNYGDIVIQWTSKRRRIYIEGSFEMDATYQFNIETQKRNSRLIQFRQNQNDIFLCLYVCFNTEHIHLELTCMCLVYFSEFIIVER